MAINYDAIAAAGGIPKGPTRFDSKKDAALEAAANERAVYLRVNARDRYSCRVCGKRCNPDGISLLDRGHHHHLHYRSAGGPTTTANVCLLCARCHNAEHKGKLQLSGDADLRDPLTNALCGIHVERPGEGGMETVAWV